MSIERDRTISVEAGVKNALPHFLATVRWDTRRTEYTDEVAETLGVDIDGLIGLIESNERFADSFAIGASRSQSVADPDYRVALARLAAAAADDALVDEVGYLITQLVLLQPVTLRVLVACLWCAPEADAGGWRPFRPELAKSFPYVFTRGMSESELVDLLGISRALCRTAAQALVTNQFFGADESVPTDDDGGHEPYYRPTGWACRSYDLLYSDVTIHRLV